MNSQHQSVVIVGIGPDASRDPHPGDDFEPDYYLLEEVIWEKLAHRIPAMEQLRQQRAWAGHYEMNLLDHNGIVGAHDVIRNFLMATGFSGHGVMHSPAVGRGIAEWIVHGRYTSLDLSPLRYDRIRDRQPIIESIVY